MTLDKQVEYVDRGWWKKAIIVPVLAFLVSFAVLYSGHPSATHAQNIPNYVADPCQHWSVAKSSASISIAAAGTTQPIAPAAGKVVYVCGATFTIAPSGTSADTLQFTSGTGATCGTSTVTNTGTFGNGDLTTTTGIAVVSFSDPGASFSTATGAGVCLVAGGATVNIQGVMEYVQQ